MHVHDYCRKLILGVTLLIQGRCDKFVCQNTARYMKEREEKTYLFNC